MIGAMSLQEAQGIVGGEILGFNATFESVSIDTRTLQAGDLFVAITGPNFNGNKFIAKAVGKKAKAAIVSENLDSDIPILKVEDTRLALGKMAGVNRAKSNACVIGLTGSQGKTTVKEMVAKILQQCGEVMYTQGNLNNDFGVPLSLLQINAEDDFAVIEMGASGPGEIAYCAELVCPEIAHITNVAATHLEGFGSLEGVAKAKGELWEKIQANGIAIVNIDDQFAEQWCKQIEARDTVSVVEISAKGKASAKYYLTAVHANRDLTTDFVLHTPVGETKIKLNLAGAHNSANALAAAALSMEAGASIYAVENGLSQVTPVAGRLSSAEGINSSIIIDDSYNASPSSFKAAIDVLASLPGKRIIVMGDMGELGADAEEAHQDVGFYAKKKGINAFYGCGPLSSLAVKSFGVNGFFAAEKETVVKKLIPSLAKDVSVLVKGSRSANMDKIFNMLIKTESKA